MKSRAGGFPNASRIDLLNIGLMLGSAAVALYLPFELFLFSYAVLGPLHYLTEISWLHERNYFTKGRRDHWMLAALAVVVFVSQLFSGGQGASHGTIFAVALFVAFFGSLVLVVTRSERARFVALVAVVLLAATAPAMRLFLMVFLPTLVHVYVFTGLFMLHGALKGRSWTGYLAFVVFLLCPLAFVWFTPEIPSPTDNVTHVYSRFSGVNFALLSSAGSETVWDADPLKMMRPIFFSAQGLVVMRFIAFAYTYHYLNWFSKTSVIQWHRVSKGRLAMLAGLWLGAVGLYAYDYSWGFTALFGLGLLHVVLEFPLNHISIIGIFREVRGRVKGGVVDGRTAEQVG